jgi:hypothetical protein
MTMAKELRDAGTPIAPVAARARRLPFAAVPRAAQPTPVA